MKRPLALLISLALLVGSFALAYPHANNTPPTQEPSAPVEMVTELHPLPEGSAVTSEHFAVSTAEMAYLYQFVYSQYAQYLASYGVDSSQSLKDQMFSEDMSWYDFLMAETKTYAAETLALCEAARAADITLDAAAQSEIDSLLSSMDDYAASAGYDDTALYIESAYGPGVTLQALQEYLEKNYLASTYLIALQNDLTYTDEEIQAAYDANPRAYQLIDCAFYTFSVDAEKGRASAVCEAKMNELAAVTSLDDFFALVEEDIRAIATEEELASLDMETEKQALQYTGVPYAEGVPFLERAFDGSLAENTGLAVPDVDNGVYTVYFLTRAPYREESAPRSVRHILLKTESQGSAEKAREAAEEILAQWQAGDATEDSFAALANAESEDPGSNTQGGLYADVTQGQMVAEFNDWLFDAARQPGDVDIVDTSYGNHVMYYVGEGAPIWKSSVTAALADADYTAAFTAAVEQYPVTYDESLIAAIGG